MRQDSPGDGGSSSGGPGDGASSSVGGAADAAAAVTVGSIACVPAAAAVAAPAPAASPASPASPLGAVLPPDVRHSSDPPVTASDPPVEAHQTRSQWRRQVHRELRDRLVNGMFEELQRIMGAGNVRHLRQCATRYESFVWKKSASQDQYKSKLERRIESLRRQPPQPEAPFAASTQIPSQGGEEGDAAWALLATPHRHRSSRSSSSRRSSSSKRSSSGRRSSRRSSSAPSSVPSSPFASAVSSPRGSLASPLSGTQIWRDEQYFSRLRAMKTKYRDEVALVFRELCRVNTVIQHSASLRRHESNNLGDFLANLKKIIYLLEQQPDEMSGMIPPRKRTLEYLDVVESHIQRKVLPILHRLRHTYSTILRPIVLNYLRNCTRHTRRL